MTDEKKIIENNFDRMREVISNTRLPINVGDTTVGETYLREGDIFRIATALINEGFRLERKGKWVNEDFPDRPASQLTMAICSACGGYAHRTGHGYNILSKYCPYCGSKMLEE